MVFCGQCGLQLSPGSTACPRCGSVTEPDLSLAADEPHLYDPTVVTPLGATQTPRTPAYEQQLPTVSPTPPQQQKLVLRPDGTVPPYGSANPYDPTSMTAAQPPVSSPDRHGYPHQSNPAYPAQPVSYPGMSPQSDAGYPPIQGQYGNMGSMPPLSPRRKKNGRVVVLLSILIVLLLLLGSMVVVAMQPQLLKGLFGNTTATPTPVITQTVLSPSDHARLLMQDYYRAINARDYQGAYNMWGSNFQSTNTYNSFAAGFANTLHDDLTINSTNPLANGTISMDITLRATENLASGTRVSTYHGIYIIGQENGAWKFLSGNFHKVA